VIHIFQDVDVEVAEIAWDEQADDLPLAVGKLLVATAPAVENEMDIARLVAFGDQVAASLDDA
jgi:hypothetical protein